MPETLAERIARKAGQSVLRLTGDVDLGEKNLRELFALAVIRDFVREVAAQIEAEATDYMGQGRRGLLRGRQILLRAAGGEG